MQKDLPQTYNNRRGGSNNHSKIVMSKFLLERFVTSVSFLLFSVINHSTLFKQTTDLSHFTDD
jgi:hypothetical protein